MSQRSLEWDIIAWVLALLLGHLKYRETQKEMVEDQGWFQSYLLILI